MSNCLNLVGKVPVVKERLTMIVMISIQFNSFIWSNIYM